MTTVAALAALALSVIPFTVVLRALVAGPELVIPDPPAPQYRYEPELHVLAEPLPARPDGFASLKAEIRASAEPVNVYDLGLPALVPQRRILTGAPA